MAIPDYQTLMLPILKAISDKKEYKISDLYEKMSKEFNLSDEERESRLPSGGDTYIKNRVSWARTYLKKAGLVSSPSKGVVVITNEGLKVLDSKPDKIDNVYLRKFKGFVEFRPRNSDVIEGPGAKVAGTITEEKDDTNTPEERFDQAYQSLRRELSEELLDTVKSSNAYFFERVVVDLMLAMGYGGSRQDAGEATKRSADGGVDGVIKLDKLGLDKICLQAKRYTDVAIGEPKIRDFAGALQGYKAKKGVFITTSSFTGPAIEYAEKIENEIVLIDGERLCNLMIDYNIGLSRKEVYELKSIDTDYFSDN